MKAMFHRSSTEGNQTKLSICILKTSLSGLTGNFFCRTIDFANADSTGVNVGSRVIPEKEEPIYIPITGRFCLFLYLRREVQ